MEPKSTDRHHHNLTPATKFLFDYDETDDSVNTPKEFFRSRINAVRKKIRQHAVQTGDWPAPHVIFGPPKMTCGTTTTISLKEKLPPGTSQATPKSSKFNSDAPSSSAKLTINPDTEINLEEKASKGSSRRTIFKRSKKNKQKSNDNLKTMIARMRDGPEINESKFPVFIESDDGGLICPGMDMNGIIQGFVEFEKYFKRGGLLPFANVMPTPIKNPHVESLNSQGKAAGTDSSSGGSCNSESKSKDFDSCETNLDSTENARRGRERPRLDPVVLSLPSKQHLTATQMLKKQVKFEKETEYIPLSKKGNRKKETPLIPPCAASPSVLKKSSSLDSRSKTASNFVKLESDQKKNFSFENTKSCGGRPAVDSRAATNSNILVFANRQFHDNLPAELDEDNAGDSSELSNDGFSSVEIDENSTESLPGGCEEEEEQEEAFDFDADELGLAIQQCLDNIKLSNSPTNNEDHEDSGPVVSEELKHQSPQKRSSEHSKKLWRRLFRLTKNKYNISNN